MKALEIIARGPSRKPPSPVCDHWYLSTSLTAMPDTGMVFSLHGDDLLEPWLHDCGRVVVMGASKKLPNADFIESAKRVEWYGPVFGCSVAWMICEAILAGYKVIRLNGVDHARPDERRERESIAYWCGMARSQGVTVETDPTAGFKLNWGAYPRC
jgi:hypothetical protein